jgi:transcriptional regulator with XRE-family HTH domain
LKHWRRLRGLSQLELAVESEVSTRHVSFLETGRSAPSREMVLRLAETLDVPLRERNSLLSAAGFASIYHETDLDAPEMELLRRMLAFILEQHAPFPAYLVDRCWNVLRMNSGATTLFAGFARDGGEVWSETPLNLARVMLHPDGLRPLIVNFEEVAGEMMMGLHRALTTRPDDSELEATYEELRALPGMPQSVRVPDLSRPPLLVLPIHIKQDDMELQLFTAVTQVSSAQDVTVEELRIETIMPADAASEALLRAFGEAAKALPPT